MSILRARKQLNVISGMLMFQLKEPVGMLRNMMVIRDIRPEAGS